jgi:acetate kinase
VNVLAVNSGSSSVRLAAFKDGPEGLDSIGRAHYEVDKEKPAELLGAFLSGHAIKCVDVFSHRVVHGGSRLAVSCLIDAKVEREIERLSSLAPLHNPVALKWIRTCRDMLGPHVPSVAVFDTAFYKAMPDVAKHYALPREICLRHEVSRYGFDGLAHRAMWQRWRELRPDIEGGGRLISLQLGAGCSITAVDRGLPKDTSMGFSPLEGLVMATRSGDIDPGLVAYIQRTEGLSVEGLENMLNNSSGLLGASGLSGDMQKLLESDEPDARLAVELYCYRAMKYIGAYLNVLGGADAVVFGGGVGENAPVVRERILEGMQWCGIHVDVEANNDTVGKEGRVSQRKSGSEVWVVQVDEASILAREAIAVMKQA